MEKFRKLSTSYTNTITSNHYQTFCFNYLLSLSHFGKFFNLLMVEQDNTDNIQAIPDYTNNQIITPIPYTFHLLKNNNESILIATHNIQGMNNITKFQQWIQFCHDSQLDIISITETKLASSTHNNFKFLNSYYKIFFANTTSISKKKQEASMGTAIAVKNSLCLYIHNIQTFEGYRIAIDLFFPGN